MNNVLSTYVSVVRNLKDYKFTPKLEESKMAEIVDKVAAALPNFKKVEIANLDRNVVNLPIFKSKYNTALLSEDGRVAITFFDGEHITIMSAASGYDADCFKRVHLVSEQLKNALNLVYNDDYGYLTSNLFSVGNGLKLSCSFALSGIVAIGKIDQVKQNVHQFGFNLTNGEYDDQFVLSTGCNLGYTSSEVAAEFEKMANKLQELERDSVKLYASTNADEIYDRYLRAVAVLKNAYLMPNDELSAHIKTLRMGLNLGYNEVDSSKINALQKLLKDEQFVSVSGLKATAEKVKAILGGKNV